MAKIVNLAVQTFDEASKIWLAAVKLQVAPRTYRDYQGYVETLSSFFGSMRMSQIEIDHIEEYQQQRTGTVVRGKLATGVAVNHEIGLALRQMLKRCGRWAVIGPRYRPIRQPKDYEGPGKALTINEEERIAMVFREAAENNPSMEVAALASLLSMRTSMGPGEIRSLKLKDLQLDMQPPRLQIPLRGAKRRSRARTVVLVGEALWAVQKLLERAKKTCGCQSPDDFLIPFRPYRNRYEPSKPSGGWRYSLRELLGAAGIKMRAYDFRHHAITRLLENPNVSEQTAQEVAGWINPKMKARYSHARISALQGAAFALDRPLKNPKVMAPVQKISNAQKQRAI